MRDKNIESIFGEMHVHEQSPLRDLEQWCVWRWIECMEALEVTMQIA